MEGSFASTALNDMLNCGDLIFDYDNWCQIVQDIDHCFVTKTMLLYRRERFVIEKFGSIEAYVRWWLENRNK